MDSGRGAQPPVSPMPFAGLEQVGPLSLHQQLEQPSGLDHSRDRPPPALAVGRGWKETPWHEAMGSSLVAQVAPRR